MYESQSLLRACSFPNLPVLAHVSMDAGLGCHPHVPPSATAIGAAPERPILVAWQPYLHPGLGVTGKELNQAWQTQLGYHVSIVEADAAVAWLVWAGLADKKELANRSASKLCVVEGRKEQLWLRFMELMECVVMALW
jgi:hypothetical protein